MKKIWAYIEPMWLGYDNKVSLRRILAIGFSIDFVRNMSHIVHEWEIGKSYAEIAMVLGLEAGLIAALLSLTTYSNTVVSKKPDQHVG